MGNYSVTHPGCDGAFAGLRSVSRRICRSWRGNDCDLHSFDLYLVQHLWHCVESESGASQCSDLWCGAKSALLCVIWIFGNLADERGLGRVRLVRADSAPRCDLGVYHLLWLVQCGCGVGREWYA